MKKTNPRKYAVAGLGEWGVAEGLVFENWTVKSRDINKENPDDWKAFFGLDYGYVNDPTAFIAFYVNKKTKEIHIFDEFYKKRMLNSDIAEEIKKRGLHIVTYSGYTFEQIISGIKEGRPGWKELLSVTDLLIDGRFVLEEKSLNILFRGSKNQRLIDVKKSLEAGEAVLWDPEEESGVLRYKK